MSIAPRKKIMMRVYEILNNLGKGIDSDNMLFIPNEGITVTDGEETFTVYPPRGRAVGETSFNNGVGVVVAENGCYLAYSDHPYFANKPKENRFYVPLSSNTSMLIHGCMLFPPLGV